MDKQLLDKVMAQVQKPVRYMGNEYNMVEKNPSNVSIRYAFAFPDVYEVGMSHLGMKILYHLINEREDTYCERVFAPWIDMEQMMRSNGIPLFSLETKDSIREFDIVGFTLQYEMSYTNILNMLDLAGIPLTCKERNETHPLIMAGGPCAYNVEPMADFFDLVVIGEGEEVIHEILDLYIRCKNAGIQKDEFLTRAVAIGGVYVPKLYQAGYNEDGTIKQVSPLKDEAPAKVQKRIVMDLDKTYFPETMVVPYMDIVHDRIMLEVFRGCTRGCRFCQAGMIYRPVRERSVERLLNLAEKLIDNTGYEEISLASLSTGDYSDLEILVGKLMKYLQEKRVSLSLPSLRLDSFIKELAEEVQKVRKTGLTFAPEAGTQRMRDVINKGITEEDLLSSVLDAFESGWDGVKLYFMIGLPGEKMEDLEGIGELTGKIKDCYYEVKKEGAPKRLKITVSTSSFVPKAFTPFQWEPQNTIEELRQKQESLQKILRMKHVEYNWHDSEVSFLEAVFARGDRRLGMVLRTAWKKGCKFDGWAEQFKFDKWIEAFDEIGIDPSFYANRKREKEEIFPWDHIDTGVNKAYLWNEYQKALRGELTHDCRIDCTGCGVRKLGEGIC